MPPSAVTTETPFWQLPLSVLLEQLVASPDGLSGEEAALRLTRFGPNLIHAERKRALLLQFLAKFRNPLVILLLAASAISAFTGDATSFFIIGAIVLMSVTLDFVQEYRAGQAAERLRQSVAVRVRVLRDGKQSDIPMAELVPGDVALLSAGDLVPGDGRVLVAKDFFVNQALLTGEPYPVEKSPGELSETADMAAAGNGVFWGTSVISGTASVLICRTGQNTALGEIADSLVATAPPTSFELGTHRFGFLIMRMTVLLVLFVLLVNAFFHRPWLESFLFAMALAVGLTPELLPIPLDRVDDDYLSHPRHWDMRFIRNFMLVIGPVSSVFDFLTFYIMLAVFHAGEALFHTGWFIESMATQVLVIFIIRTRKNPFKSRPNPWLIACSLSVVAVAVFLPFTSAGGYLGFVTPPVFFFLILATMLIAYLLAVEGMKRWFFRRFAAE
ncbi:MAG: cation-transporting P-type ATPase [Geobacteraceae bacterium]|nr:cation-transporting P-type ATPase [Geobacteraceae bacterium]